MEYLHRDRKMAINAVENVLLVGWLGDPDRTSAEVLRDTTKVIVGRHPSGIAHLNVVAKHSKPQVFDESSRKGAMRVTDPVSARVLDG